jgi:hypothetical protein
MRLNNRSDTQAFICLKAKERVNNNYDKFA